MNEDGIRIEDVAQCPVCRSEKRKVLYTGLRDCLFGTPEKWTLKECHACLL